MGIECAYSFDDLYFAATSKHLSALESERFLQLSQDEKNHLVRQWANQAKWMVEDRIGSDGLTYSAFWPARDERS